MFEKSAQLIEQH